MLVYGREALLRISLEFPTLELAHQLELIENDVISIRMDDFIELEESRNKGVQSLEMHQQ